MLVVHSLHGLSLGQRLVKACAAPDAQLAESLADLRDLLPSSRRALVGCPRLDQKKLIDLRMMGALAPGIPITLVTDPDPSSLVLLKDLIVDQVVFVDDAELQLPSLTGLSGLESSFCSLAAYVQNAPITDRLRKAIALSVFANPPMISVKALAKAVGVRPVTLRREWQSAFENRPTLDTPAQAKAVCRGACQFPPPIKQFLANIAVGRAVQLRVGGMSWEEVEDILRVQRRLLRRHAGRITGLSAGLNLPSDEQAYRRWLGGCVSTLSQAGAVEDAAPR